MKQQVRIIKGKIFNRWYIVNFEDETKAWSGSRWVAHENGLPLDVQISNFDTKEDALEYARSFEFEVID